MVLRPVLNPPGSKRAGKPSTYRHIGPREYDYIVSVFAKHNGLTGPVACELGWESHRTKRVYDVGYPRLGFPPARTMIAMDRVAADEVRAQRARLSSQLPPSVEIEAEDPAEQQEEISQKALVIHGAEESRIRALMQVEEDRRLQREDAVKARAEEAMLVSITRRNALALNGVTTRVMKGALALSERIQERLEEEARANVMSAGQMLALAKSAASVARFNSEVTALAIKAERAVLGEPIASAPNVDEGDSSLDTAVAWIEKAVKAVNRAKERGVVRK